MEVVGRMSFLGNFLPTLRDFPESGALPPVDFLATGDFPFLPFPGDLCAPGVDLVAVTLAGVRRGESFLLLFRLWSFFFNFSAKLSSKVLWVKNPELQEE